jgi:membrane fusion protein (multidrug efflux system)
MKKWTFFMLLIAIVLFGSVIGFNFFVKNEINKAIANMPEPSNPVTVETIKLNDWVPTIEAVGFIEPAQGVTLTNQTEGVIDSIQFESGQTVKAGKTLIVLESDVEQANLKSVQARLPAAKAKFERYKGLFNKGSLSQEAYDDAQASYLSLSADLESLKAAVEKRTIQAPFSGIVGIRNIYLGQYLKAATEIVQLEDISRMRFHFSIPQTEISRITSGQTVDISVDSYPNQTFTGSITAIEPAVNPLSGLIQVEADIPNSDSLLRSGMFARASIRLPALQNQVAITQTAITYTLYGDSVYVLVTQGDEQRVEQRVIEVGERRGSIAHIRSGLAGDETIVTSGQVRLNNGAKVHVVESNAVTPRAEIPML